MTVNITNASDKLIADTANKLIADTVDNYYLSGKSDLKSTDEKEQAIRNGEQNIEVVLYCFRSVLPKLKENTLIPVSDEIALFHSIINSGDGCLTVQLFSGNAHTFRNLALTVYLPYTHIYLKKREEIIYQDLYHVCWDTPALMRNNKLKYSKDIDERIHQLSDKTKCSIKSNIDDKDRSLLEICELLNIIWNR